MFHRVDDPLTELDSARFFRMAERLPVRDGAVRAALLREAKREQAATPGPPPAPGPAAPIAGLPRGARVEQVDDPQVLAAMTKNQQGFPSIAYKRG